MKQTSVHPDLDTWEQLACNELDAASRAAVMKHVESCPECQEIQQAIGEVREAATAFDPGLRELPRTIRPANSWRPWLAMAASTLLATGWLATQWQPARDPPSPVTAATVERAGEQSSLQVSEPREGAVGNFTSFVWEPLPLASFYVVELFSGDGALQWSSGEILETELPWPEEVPKEPGGEFYWRVAAELDDVLVYSPMVRFKMKALDESR